MDALGPPQHTQREKSSRPLRLAGPHLLILSTSIPFLRSITAIAFCESLVRLTPCSVSTARPALAAGRPRARPHRRRRTDRRRCELRLRPAHLVSHRRPCAIPQPLARARITVAEPAVAPETVHYRTCPFCEATCGLEVTMRGDEVVSVRGDDDDVFSHGFLCPKSQGLKQLHDDPDRLTTPLVRRDGELVEASWEEAFAEVDDGLRGCSPRAGATRSPSISATPPPTASARRSTGAASEGARLEEHLLRLDRRPDAEAGLGRADVRRRPQRPDARRRPHRPPADPRRQPAGLQRLAADRARHARPDPRDPRARRQGRRRRPAPQPHRQGGLRAPLHPSRHRRPAAVRDRQRAARRGARRAGPAGRARQRRRADRRRSPRRSRPRPWRPICGIEADEIRTPGARAGRAPSAPPSTGGSGPRPSASARSRAGSST